MRRRLRASWIKARALFQRDRLDDELIAELASHIAHHIDDNMRAGMSADEARRLALAKLGGVEPVRERHRDVRSYAWFEDARRDSRLAVRQLRHSPVFALTAILILTVGIGLNLTIFQLLNVTLLRPLPIADPGTLVRFDRVSKYFSSNGVPYPATQFVRHNNAVLAAVLTCHSTDAVWEDDVTDRLRASYVSANWFAELGFQADTGRLFVEAIDERPDAPAVVVISHAFWRTRLSSGSAVGRVVRINDRPATIIGVAPANVPGLRLEDPQVWLLIHQIDRFNPGMAFTEAWGSHTTQLYARLRTEVSADAARDGLRPTLRELAILRPQEFQPDEVLQPYSGRDGFRSARDQREVRSFALLAAGLTLIVLLVACANLSNMVMSRSIGRLRELSVRAALGATRGRLLRHQLAESVLLTILGALGGFLLSRWGVSAAAAYASLPTYLDFRPDWRMLAATSVVAVLTTAAVGLIPAWMMIRRDLIGAIKDGGHQASRGLARAPLGALMVGSQVAGCSVLLIVAGLTVRSVERLLTADRGFDVEQVAVLDPSLPRYGVQNEAARTYWSEVKRTIRASNPDVALALASQAPLGDGVATSKYNDAPALVVASLTVDSSFFSLLRIPLVAGRSFDDRDSADLSVIVSRRLALEMYGTVAVVGKGFPRSAPAQTIVGVAADAPLTNVTATRVAEQYAPVDERHYGTVVLLARTTGHPERLLAPMRAAARAADGRVLPATWLPSTRFDERVRERRVASFVAMLVAMLAMSLACCGIVGLVVCGVSVRTKEISIRRALGAEDASIVRLLLRQLLLPVGLGMVVGTIAASAVARVLEGEPFYLPSVDIATLSGVLGLFVVAVAVALLSPVFRALRIDPLPALKHE